MAVLSQEDYFNRLHERVGNDTSEEGIAFLEDMTDTFNDLNKRANGDGEDWKQRYMELDEAWKTRYRHRFFSGNVGDYVPPIREEADTGYQPDKATIESLFE